METISLDEFVQQGVTLFDHLGPKGLLITRDGRAIAQLMPVPDAAQAETPAQKLARLRDWLARNPPRREDQRSTEEILGYDEHGLPS